MTQSQERAAQNEIVFRDANEKLGEKRVELDARGPTPFLCECSDPRCTQVIQLTLSEYEHVRSQPTWFLVAVGHEPGGGKPAEEHAEYAIVEKSGVAGEMAERQNPRDE